MKKVFLMFWLVVLFVFSGQTLHACMCQQVMAVLKDGVARPDPEQFRKWAAEQTDFAFFVGTVVKIEKVKVRRFGSSADRSSMKKVTVSVDWYWSGVKNPEIVIYTGVGGGDCGVRYAKGRQYFFSASGRGPSGLLETNICSARELNDKLLNQFNEVFGQAKEFPS